MVSCKAKELRDTKVVMLKEDAIRMVSITELFLLSGLMEFPIMALDRMGRSLVSVSPLFQIHTSILANTRMTSAGV